MRLLSRVALSSYQKKQRDPSSRAILYLVLPSGWTPDDGGHPNGHMSEAFTFYLNTENITLFTFNRSNLPRFWKSCIRKFSCFAFENTTGTTWVFAT